MKNETYDFLMLAITIIMIAAFMGVLLTTITYGRTLWDWVWEKFETDQDRVVISELLDINDGVRDIPVAAVMEMLDGPSSSVIDKAKSDLRVPVKGDFSISYKDIHNYISGRCKLEVVKQTNGLYKVVIHHTDCRVDQTGECTGCGR